MNSAIQQTRSSASFGSLIKSYGVSVPLSSDHPTQKDNDLTAKLEDTLRKYNIFETDSELRHRMDVLYKINGLFKEWIKRISINKVKLFCIKSVLFRMVEFICCLMHFKNMPEEVAVKLGGKVCTFGSFRLGVNSKGADIDTLCIAPRHIERIDFFTSFADLLKKQPETEKLMVKFPHYLAIILVVVVEVSSTVSSSTPVYFIDDLFLMRKKIKLFFNHKIEF